MVSSLRDILFATKIGTILNIYMRGMMTPFPFVLRGAMSDGIAGFHPKEGDEELIFYHAIDRIGDTNEIFEFPLREISAEHSEQ